MEEEDLSQELHDMIHTLQSEKLQYVQCTYAHSTVPEYNVHMYMCIQADAAYTHVHVCVLCSCIYIVGGGTHTHVYNVH